MATLTAVVAGGNWTTAATWSPAQIPTAADDVKLASTSGNVTITSGAVCRSLDCTGYTGTLSHGTSVELNIGDATAGLGNIALKFVPGMTYSVSSSGQRMRFISTSATQQSVDYGGKSVGNQRFDGAGGSWILNSGLTTSYFFYHLQGTLNLNGQIISVGDTMGDSGSTSTRVLTLGAAAITTLNWSFTPTGLTFNPNTSTITITGGSATLAGLTYNNVILTNQETTVFAGNNFTNLTYTPTVGPSNIYFQGAQTISGTLTITGNSILNRALVQSTTVGQTRTLTAATVAATNADFMDITGAGAGNWNLSAISGLSGDCGGNSGITFTTSATQTATGTSGFTWSTHGWTSRVPLPQDDVVINNAFSGGQTITADSTRLGRSINFTGCTGSPIVAFGSTSKSMFGSLTLVSGITTTGTGSLHFRGRSARTLTSAGVVLAPRIVVEAPSGTVTLQDDLTTAGSGYMDLVDGTLNDGGRIVTLNAVNGGFSQSSGTLISSGSWIVKRTSNGSFWIVTGGTTTHTGTITLTESSSSSRVFHGGGRTYGTLTYEVAGSTGPLEMFGSNTFANLNIGSGRTIELYSSTTTTITTNFNVNGASGSPTTLTSSSPGTPATLSKPSGTVTCSYLSIRDITATGGATFRALSSTNVSGNTGWLFIPMSSNNILNPYADVSINSWTTGGGGTFDLYTAIDEDVDDGSFLIRSPAAPTTANFYETNLEGVLDPSSSTGHTVHYSYQKNVAGGNINLTAGLFQGSTQIASWPHTNISTAWTQQNQTLSGAQADSITDYTDLRLRFTPNTVTSDAAIAKVADRATANSNTEVTTVDLVLTGLTVDNYLIIRSAADNSGGGGAARTMTVSNQIGTAMGTTTTYQQNNDPGSASQGTTCNVAVVKIAATSGTIRLTYSGSVVQACVAEEWSGIHLTTPVVQTSSGTRTADTTLTTVFLNDVPAGNLVYGAVATEGPASDTITNDNDAFRGTWVALTKLGTTNATADTNQMILGDYKAVTELGSQQHNMSSNNARDSASLFLELASAGGGTIRTQVSWAQMQVIATRQVAHNVDADLNKTKIRTHAVSAILLAAPMHLKPSGVSGGTGWIAVGGSDRSVTTTTLDSGYGIALHGGTEDQSLALLGQEILFNAAVTVSQLTLSLSKTGSPTDNVYCAIRSTVSGSNIAVSNEVALTTVSSSGATTINFNINCTLQSGLYVFCLFRTGARDTSNYGEWRTRTDNVYPDGNSKDGINTTNFDRDYLLTVQAADPLHTMISESIANDTTYARGAPIKPPTLVQSAGETSSTTGTVTLSAAPTAGNLLVFMHRTSDGDHTGHTAPNGSWTKIVGRNASASTAGISLWWKQSDGTETTTTFTPNTATTAWPICAEFSGDFIFSNLIADFDSVADGGVNVTSLMVPAVNALGPDLVLTVLGTNAAHSGVTWSNDIEIQERLRSAMGYEVRSDMGPVTAETISWSVAGRAAAITVVFRAGVDD